MVTMPTVRSRNESIEPRILTNRIQMKIADFRWCWSKNKCAICFCMFRSAHETTDFGAANNGGIFIFRWFGDDTCTFEVIWLPKILKFSANSILEKSQTLCQSGHSNTVLQDFPAHLELIPYMTANDPFSENFQKRVTCNRFAILLV